MAVAVAKGCGEAPAEWVGRARAKERAGEGRGQWGPSRPSQGLELAVRVASRRQVDFLFLRNALFPLRSAHIKADSH
jgi:hypothetical protein